MRLKRLQNLRMKLNKNLPPLRKLKKTAPKNK
jgi:hypothetical protein